MKNKSSENNASRLFNTTNKKKKRVATDASNTLIIKGLSEQKEGNKIPTMDRFNKKTRRLRSLKNYFLNTLILESIN